jgi:hypothetical protein
MSKPKIFLLTPFFYVLRPLARLNRLPFTSLESEKGEVNSKKEKCL